MPLFILFMSILPLSFDLLCFIALMNQCVPNCEKLFVSTTTELELPNCTIILYQQFYCSYG
ncbi:hypothetical protein NC651_001526 [Populus alba x Populus x berolinensis]|nr:hypothetical protein NC651_001526 [Populus alba x Populus x berolinensis]